jgi:hypothetical protein
MRMGGEREGKEQRRGGGRGCIQTKGVRIVEDEARSRGEKHVTPFAINLRENRRTNFRVKKNYQKHLAPCNTSNLLFGFHPWFPS